MRIRKLAGEYHMSDKAMMRETLLKELRKIEPHQYKRIMISMIEDKELSQTMQEIIRKHLHINVKLKKNTLAVSGDLVDFRKILALRGSSVWERRDQIISKALSVTGGASTQGLAAYLCSNYMDLRYLTDGGGLSSLGRLHLSLLLRMAGFQNGVCRRRMDNCDLNTTGRAWSLPRNLKHTALQALIDNAEILMMKAQDIDIQETSKERKRLEEIAEIQNPKNIEDLI